MKSKDILLKEGLSLEFLNKSKSKFIDFFKKLKNQLEFNNQLGSIFLKYSKGSQLTPDELSQVKLIVTDTMKLIGLGSIALAPIPGGTILMLFLINSAKKLGIDLIPSQFNNKKDIIL